MNTLLSAFLSTLSIGAATLAQYAGGVNVDFNATAGAGAGQPTILFGGAAGQGGYWNPVNGPYNNGIALQLLRDLGNSINAVGMTYSWSGAATRNVFSFNNASTAGDTELLLDDNFDLDVATTGLHSFQLNQFAAGVYRVVTYAVTPDQTAGRTNITVRTNQGNAGTQTVGGAIPAGGAMTLGVTHAQHDLPLYFNGPIFIDAATSASFGAVNGFQIQRLAPTRLYVRGTTPVFGAGLSWAAPLPSLQSALAIARVTPSVTEIWIAGGTYYTDVFPFTAGDPAARFDLRSNLAIYGGFAGTEASTAERNLNNPANETVLDGHGIAQLIVLGSAVTGVTLDGLTASHGLTGFAFDNSSATMTRCIARDNRLGGTGVLVDVNNNSAVTLNRCAAVNNVGNGSGAILHLFAGGTLNVYNTLIANNDIGLNLIDASTGTRIDLRSCTFANNRGVNPGELVRVYGAPTTTIDNCIFWGNTIGGTLAGETGTNGVIDNVNWNNVSIVDNIIQGWTGTLGFSSDLNNGNDPRFLAPVPAGVNASPIPLNAYTLASRSPARDSGWTAGSFGIADFFGNTRSVDDPFFPNTGFGGSFLDRGYAEAQEASTICPGDIGSQGGLPGADGVRDNNDFVVFVNFFFAPDARADVGRQGGNSPGDGMYDNNDFIVFINMFFAPCP